MRTVTDQMGREVRVPERPRRIVSLVPSQTELLFDLGLDEEIVGVTQFCVRPAEKVCGRRRVGGTKVFRVEAVAELRPDLVLANKGENSREGILQLAESFPVWVSDVETLEGALEMIRRVGELTGRADAAEALAERIEADFEALAPLDPPLRVGYFIWREPFRVAGEGTFIDEMLSRCGLRNGFAGAGAGAGAGRYPEVTAEALRAARLDALLLSSEPFPFREKHRREFEALLPGVPVHLVDGEIFSWYGSRLRFAAGYFRELQRELTAKRRPQG